MVYTTTENLKKTSGTSSASDSRLLKSRRGLLDTAQGPLESGEPKISKLRHKAAQVRCKLCKSS